MVGSSCSLRTMLREHCLAVFAPRGNLFKSNSIAPVEINHRQHQKHILSTLLTTIIKLLFKPQIILLNMQISNNMSVLWAYPGSHLQRSDQHPILEGWVEQESCTLSHPRKTWIPSWRWLSSPQPLDSQRGRQSASWSFPPQLESDNAHLCPVYPPAVLSANWAGRWFSIVRSGTIIF